MCTVTIVPLHEGFRLASNRDERLERGPASAPQLRPMGNGTAVFPVDVASGGTWVGVNDAGLAAALLNRSSGLLRGAADVSSRGLIIPSLLAHRSIADAAIVAQALDPGAFEPFRLVLVQGATLVNAVSDGQRLSCETCALASPVLFTSSALGDSLVDGPRRELFERLMAAAADGWLRAQMAFHHHQWRDRPGISVTMRRPDAATLSRTVIDVVPGSISIAYEPLGPDGEAPSSVRIRNGDIHRVR
jgi:hypothetical protein